MVAEELVLHVGLQQTGAGMLGRALDRLRPQLRRHGVALIGHDALTALPDLDGWRHHAVADEDAAVRFERGVAGLVDEEARAVCRTGAPLRTILLSSDHLLGQANLDEREEDVLRPHAEASVAQMVRALGPARTRVLCYVRRQDRLMEACYLRALQNGATHDLADQFPRAGEGALDYEGLLGRLEGVAGIEAVRVRPFEVAGAGAPAMARDVLVALGLAGRIDPGAVGDDLRPYRLYSHRAALIARDVNPYLDAPRERRLVRDFLLGLYPGTDDASTRVLSPEERQRILAAHADANHRLFARRMPHLPAAGYASEQDTDRLVAVGRGRAPAPGYGHRVRDWAARTGRLLATVPARLGAGTSRDDAGSRAGRS